MTAASAFYELMDLSTANLIGHFATEDEALAVVKDVVADEGLQAAEDFALSCQPRGQRPTLIASGQALAERALEDSVVSA